MKICGFVFFLTLFCASNILAGIRPSFSLDSSSWKATHIVVATEGEELDGNFTVLESLKGDLLFGETLFVRELAAFKAESLRQVKDWDANNIEPAKFVSGAKMILFLKKNPAGKELWEPPNIFKDFNTSVLWLDENGSFAFLQTMNPGASILVDYEKSETEIRNRINEMCGLERSLDNALKIEDKTERAAQLERFVVSDFYPAREKAFGELEKCGPHALPVLRKMLGDELLLKHHPDIIKSLAAVGGREIGNELTEIVREEMKFWKATAPNLRIGWWNEPDKAEIEDLRNRYSKVLEALRRLRELKFEASRRIVIKFRGFWRSLPQLEDRSGLDQMSEECDALLRELGSK